MTIDNTVSSDCNPRSSIVKGIFDCRLSGVGMGTKSEYNQERSQSQTEDQPTAPKGRDTEHKQQQHNSRYVYSALISSNTMLLVCSVTANSQ